MKFFTWCKDGGPDSTVDAFIIIEIKSLFSIMLLKFNPGTHENYHSHAFNAITWWLKGIAFECSKPSLETDMDAVPWHASLIPKYTPRSKIHKIVTYGTVWALTFRGPWAETWHEVSVTGTYRWTLGHGRKIISQKTKCRACDAWIPPGKACYLCQKRIQEIIDY